MDSKSKIYTAINDQLKEHFAELREAFQALSKSEQDAFLMAQIKAMDGGSVSTSKRLKKKTRSNKKTFITETIIHHFVKKLISICWELVGLILKILEII